MAWPHPAIQARGVAAELRPALAVRQSEVVVTMPPIPRTSHGSVPKQEDSEVYLLCTAGREDTIGREHCACTLSCTCATLAAAGMLRCCGAGGCMRCGVRLLCTGTPGGSRSAPDTPGAPAQARLAQVVCERESNEHNKSKSAPVHEPVHVVHLHSVPDISALTCWPVLPVNRMRFVSCRVYSLVWLASAFR